ncbi:MAG TPA: Asp-tRNA(Asn)/Glu-tRNA(Gln) amidotransferase GatCAB subunit B, partial [Verrucomicrobiae bacterium]|nr:Asp-tRNA(Asn)/Glu-tRNA(Gln) amidotransferase GatCAB subunit B [Verrucomicrobiae bacterium]
KALVHATPEDARRIAFWLMRPDAEDAEQTPERKIDIDELITLSKLTGEGKLSSSAAKQVLDVLLATGGTAENIANELNLIQVSDEGTIAKIVEQVIAENPKAVEDLKAGQERAIGFLVGQIMKLSQGKANPAMAQSLIRKQLGL